MQRNPKIMETATDDTSDILLFKRINRLATESNYDYSTSCDIAKNLPMSEHKIFKTFNTDVNEHTTGYSKQQQFWPKILLEPKKLSVIPENLLQNIEEMKQKKNFNKKLADDSDNFQDLSKKSNSTTMSNNIQWYSAKSKSLGLSFLHQNVNELMKKERKYKNNKNAAVKELNEINEYDVAILNGDEFSAENKSQENFGDKLHIDEEEEELINDEIIFKKLIQAKLKSKLKKNKKQKIEKITKNASIWNYNNNNKKKSKKKSSVQLQKNFMEPLRQKSFVTQQILYERKLFEQMEFFKPCSQHEKLSDSAFPMHKCEQLISTMGRIRYGVEKYFQQKNFDYFVVGVIGTKGVGKSTILNLLANEVITFEHTKNLILNDRSIFPKSYDKKEKLYGSHQQQAFNFFITKSRMVLIDCPALLINQPKITNNSGEIWDLTDLSTVINMISSCHLVIVVVEPTDNENFYKLLNLAEILKTPQERTKFCCNHNANVLLIKNKTRTSSMEQFANTTQIFKFTNDSPEYRIYRETNNDSQDWIKEIAPEKPKLNSLHFPLVTECSTSSQRLMLEETVKKFRRMVFATPCRSVALDGTNITERRWLYFFAKVIVNTHDFIHNIYDNVRTQRLKLPDYWSDRKNFDLAVGKVTKKIGCTKTKK